MELAKNFMLLRERFGDTQQSLADKLGINQSMIAQIERGSRPLPSSLAVQVIKLYNIDPKEIFH